MVSIDRMGRGTRVSLLAFAVLAMMTAPVLYGPSDRTDELFAWTIHPPLTAALLGAGYAGGLPAIAHALRLGQWRQAWLWTHGLLVFSVVTAIATFAHLDRFALDGQGIPLVFAWTWVGIYVVLPVWAGILVIGVLPVAAPAAPPTWSAMLRAAWWVQAAALGAAGIALLVAPSTGDTLWPWDLSPLTARATAAWLLASGTLAFLTAREPGPRHVEAPAIAYGGFPILVAVAVVRFRDQVAWERPAAWVFSVFLVVMAATGAVTMLQARRVRLAETTGDPAMGTSEP